MVLHLQNKTSLIILKLEQNNKIQSLQDLIHVRYQSSRISTNPYRGATSEEACSSMMKS